MNMQMGLMVPLGYGKHSRSDSIVERGPVAEGLRPRQRTKVYIRAAHPADYRVPFRRGNFARFGRDAQRDH